MGSGAEGDRSPSRPATTGVAERRQRLLTDLPGMKARGDRIAMVTAYDYPGAQLVDRAGVDVVLVGDTAAMTVLGYPSTVPVSVDELLVLVRAVRRGLHHALLIGDLPFGSYEVSDEQAVATAVRFVKEGGCDGVKLERGAGTSAQRARAIVAAGIPVMGHIGLTPQTAGALGGYRVQGRDSDAAMRLGRELRDLEGAGCFAVVLEAVPGIAADALTRFSAVPTIGIGAGAGTDGQVLVYHDLLGLTKGPRFAPAFADLDSAAYAGLSAYVDQVRAGEFPAREHTYDAAPDIASELESFMRKTSAVL